MKITTRCFATALLFIQLAAFSAAQTITRVVTTTVPPESIAIDATGNAYIHSMVGDTRSIAKVTPAGVVSTFGTLPPGSAPNALGIKFDAAGNLYMAGALTGIIWRWGPAGGEATQFVNIGAVTPFGLNDMAFDRAGNMYVTNSIDAEIFRVTPAGVAQKWSTDPLLRVRAAPSLFPGATLGPNGIATSANGDLYVAITQPGRIVRIPINADGSAGRHTVFVEDDLLASVDGIAFDSNGDLYAAMNVGNRIAVIKPNGTISTVAAGGLLSRPTGLAFGRAGAERSLYVVNVGDGLAGSDRAKIGVVRIDIGMLADPATPPTDNFSARGRVGTGADILVAGFTVSGPRSKTVLIRGIGPALTAFGVTSAVADPKLDLYSASGTLIDSNDNWIGNTGFTALSASRGAFPLAAGSADAAIITTLSPGNYTAHVSGVGGSSGIALLEIYEIP